MKRSTVLYATMGFGLFLVTSAVAAKPNDEAKQAKNDVYNIWDVDSMIRQAADNVARRYNLNQQQTEFTRQMMRDRVTKFLENNEEAIWPLIRDLARQQLTGQSFDPNNPDALATAKRIGDTAIPIVEKARQAIYEANEEWGGILSKEQKQLHEYDLREMKGQFEEIRQNFENYKEGKPAPGLPMFPTQNKKADEPSRPARPSEGLISEQRRPEHQWDRYVRNFVHKYDLDDAQKESANSILRELKQRAADHRTKKAKNFEAVKKRFDEAVAKGDLKKRMAAKREEVALTKPIKSMFEELKRRVNKIPTSGQRKKAEAGSKTKKAKPHRAAKPKKDSSGK